MFIYNPLNVHGELFAVFSAAGERDEPAQRREDLLALYRPFALGRRPAGVAIPAALQEDERDLTARFRAFFGGLVEHSDLRPEVGEVPVVFPAVAVADARCIERDGRQAVFISSAMLDAIELFAGTVSICARLNQIALPSVTALEEGLPDQVALAWLTLVGDAWPGMTVPALLQRGARADELLDVLVDENDWAADDLRPGLTCYRLSHLLMQLMLRAIRRSARHGWDGAHGYPRDPIAGPLPVDRDFLAVLALAFVVLHEIGHLALGHNEIGSPPADGLREAVSSTSAQEVLLHGTQSSFELAADVFAVEIVNAGVRDPLLEAATLWCAALERTHPVAGERFDDLARLMESPDAYPSFALRVWYLNGRLSSGRRKGDIARQITAQAEGVAHELEQDVEDPVREAQAFNALWDLARAASDTEAAVFASRIAARPRRGAARSPEHDALERGVDAMEAGRLDDAEREFRAVAARADAPLAGMAHALLGRVLEERGDLRAAEEQYLRGDALGDGEAANDVGLILQARGQIAEAQEAYRRAEARGNAPAAYNLAALHHERGEDAEAAAAFARADALGDAQAAEILGMFAYERGDLDGAEAAWRRADARGAVAAANNLGFVLQQRGDIEGPPPRGRAPRSAAPSTRSTSSASCASNGVTSRARRPRTWRPSDAGATDPGATSRRCRSSCANATSRRPSSRAPPRRATPRRPISSALPAPAAATRPGRRARGCSTQSASGIPARRMSSGSCCTTAATCRAPRRPTGAAPLTATYARSSISASCRARSATRTVRRRPGARPTRSATRWRPRTRAACSSWCTTSPGRSRPTPAPRSAATRWRSSGVGACSSRPATSPGPRSPTGARTSAGTRQGPARSASCCIAATTRSAPRRRSAARMPAAAATPPSTSGSCCASRATSTEPRPPTGAPSSAATPRPTAT